MVFGIWRKIKYATVTWKTLYAYKDVGIRNITEKNKIM